jgi:hypothetical protein
VDSEVAMYRISDALADRGKKALGCASFVYTQAAILTGYLQYTQGNLHKASLRRKLRNTLPKPMVKTI